MFTDFDYFWLCLLAMLTEYDYLWLCPLAFIILLLIWHALGPHLLQGFSRIPSPDLHDIIDSLAALLCWYFLWFPSPLIWFLIFTLLKRRIPHSKPIIPQQRLQSKPITNISQPVHTIRTQFLPKDSTELLKDLIRSPIVLPSIPGMQSSYQPIDKSTDLPKTSGAMSAFRPTTGHDGRIRSPIVRPLVPGMQSSYQPIATSADLPKTSGAMPVFRPTTGNDGRVRSPIVRPLVPGMQSSYQPIAKSTDIPKPSGAMPAFRPTTGNDGRVSTTTRVDKDKQPIGSPVNTRSNFEDVPILTRNYQAPQLANSASEASFLRKRKQTEEDSSRTRSLPMARGLDITPPAESEKRRKVDGVEQVTSTGAVGKN